MADCTHSRARARAKADPRPAGAWLGDSEMGRRILAFDWAAGPLGPLDAWPRSLRTIVATCLRSGFQMAVYWGPELICIYNDAERDVLGDLHPRALGLPAKELLADSWEVLELQLRAVIERGETTSAQDLPLRFARHGRVELGYFTYSYSPVLDDGGDIGGVLLVTEETTARVLAERRIEALRRLAFASMDAATEREACALAVEALRDQPDVAFLLMYLLDDGRGRATCVAAGGLPDGARAVPAVVLGSGADGPGAVLRALEGGPSTSGSVVPADLFVSCASGGATPAQAFVTPIFRGLLDAVAGFLVAGIDDDLPVDDSYRWFLSLVALGVGRSVAAARSRETERERTRAIAALENARTALFSNASHELRTPLTLIGGALEQLLDSGETPPSARETLTLAHRNASRMLRLVNGLLDFSRIEAGEQLGAFAPTDLSQLTRDVLAMFRSTIERAGLRLSVDCPPLDDPVYVDGEAWERIVSNLLSNAVKFTPHGDISVRLRCEYGNAVLTVADTGIGVARENLERIFERFARVAHPAARTSEGSGIGLALVRELAQIHGGSVAARSRPGEGTAVTVRVPIGREHLPGGAEAQTRLRARVGDVAAPFVAEAAEWLKPAPTGSDAGPATARRRERRDRVLIVEDNADMGAYLSRLLAQDYAVDSASHGGEALEQALGDPPDIVISDLTMPGLDGLDLVRRLRADARTRDTPVVVVSARADPDDALRALSVGADDYIVKPFNARELVARVRATIYSSRLRARAGEARGRADERAAGERELHALLNDLKAAQLRVAEAGDSERRRIERNLHDGAQQRLMAIRLDLGLLLEQVDGDAPSPVRTRLEELRGDLEEALDELRELAQGLIPPLLASEGLPTALAAMARRSPIPVAIERHRIGRLPPAVENAAYFCCAEALQNATKHAGAGTRAAIRLEVRDGALEFRVTDDGQGFDPAAAAQGGGLTNLRDRVGALGGHAEIESAPGSGTTVWGQIPLP